jgi:putative membrane protein
MRRTETNGLGVFLRGICMGCADVVPGVSGGTMAYILGIYQRLVTAIRGIDITTARLIMSGRLVDAWRRADGTFLLLLGGGIVSAILLVTRVLDLPHLIETHPQPVYGLFFGLIVGSLVTLVGDVGRHRAAELALFGVGTLLGFLLVTLVPVATPDAAWFVFLAGAIAISAMLLPGVSGSFLLLILGKYEFILSAVRDGRWLDLLPFLVGCGVGVLAFARLLAWLMRVHQRVTCIVINGVLLGSLWRLWPFQRYETAEIAGKLNIVATQPVLPDLWGQAQWISVAMGVIGFLAVYAMTVISRREGASA